MSRDAVLFVFNKFKVSLGVLTINVNLCVFVYIGVHTCKCVIRGYQRSNPTSLQGFARYRVLVLESGVGR